MRRVVDLRTFDSVVFDNHLRVLGDGRSRRRLNMRILGLMLTLLCIQVSGWGQQIATQRNDVELKKLTKSAIDLVSPAIVRFSYGKESPYHFGCGVIVSPEGHIAVSGPVHAVIDNELLQLRLTDGRIVKGEALGWCSEFGFGLLKIAEDGPWPHVKVNHLSEVGEVCVALGYDRNTDHAVATKPDVHLGLVTKSCRGRWLTTTHRSRFTAHPVFDLQGELLGLCCKAPVNGDAIHASATLISDHWNDLVAGKNLDRVRLFPARSEMTDASLAKAKAASVRISVIGETESLASGTIVTADGYVITCGHHGRMPGEELHLSLRDGRSASAVVVGTNLVCDVGVLKITDDEPWPHVEMGYSDTLALGSPCVLLGYPKVKADQEPWVFRTQVIKPTQTLSRRDEWYDEFWTEEYPESIQGASGGGVFDVHGKVVGVLLGGAGQEMQHARVELFRKNWDTLTADKRVQIVETSLVEEASDRLSRIGKELSAESPSGDQ